MNDVPTGRGWKPCEHTLVRHYAYTETESSWGIYPTNWASYKGPNSYWKTFNGNQGPTFKGAADFTLNFPKTLAQQIADAKDDFYTKDNEVDSLLNLVEAPELPRSMNSLLGRLKDRSTWRPLTKISNGYLLWSFGLAPLLSDMSKVAKSVSTLRGKMSNALKHGGKSTVIRNSVTGTVTPYSTVALGHDSATWHFNGRGKRTVSILGKRSVSYNSSLFGQLDYMMRRFGGTGPASFVWERIPFSFVVDWFLDLRSITNKLDNLLTGGTKQIQDILVTTEGEFFANMVDNYAYHIPTSFKGTTVASTSVSLYRREKPVISEPTFALSGRFGKKQLSLTGALLYQLVASRGRR